MRPADALVARRDRVLAERAKGRPQRATAPVELLERRTVHSKTWDLGGGEHHLSQSVTPIHYAPAAGAPLEEIDTAWTADGQGIRMDSGPYQARILADGIGWRHTSRRGGWVEMRLVAVDGQPVAALTPPRVDGDQVTWDAVAPGVDIRIVAFAGQSEAFKRLVAPTELEWQVTEGGPANRRPKLQETLVGWDRRGDRLEILTERQGDRFRERWTGRVSRITNPASRRKGWVAADDAGPVVVDASISEDIAANVDDGFCTNSFNWLQNYSAWNVGAYFGAGSQSVAGVRWRTIAIPNGATVSAATLTVNVTQDYGAGAVRIYGADVDDCPVWTATFPRAVAKTTALKQWTPTATGVQSVDILGPVSEVLGRAGWASGNDLGLALFPNGVGAGQVVVRCEDYAAAGTDSAQLDVTYTTGPPPTTPSKVADRGSASNLTSQSSTAVDLAAGGAIATGNYLITRLALDNSGTNGAAVTLTVTDPQSNSWTVVGPANQDPGAANAGVTCYIAYAKVVNGYTNGDDLTFNYGGTNVPAKSIVVEEWTNIDQTTPVAVAATTATGASGTPSISRTPGAADQLFYGALAIEGPSGDTYTQDSDTTDGVWSTLTGLSTASGTAAANQTIRGATKLVTGTTAQTWNPLITNRDWAAVALVFAPVSTVDTVTPADATHSHAADQPTLTQVHAITPADASHGHTADEASVTQVFDVAADDAAHGHTAEAPTLTQAHALAPADAAHAQTADAPVLTQAHSLTAADASHGQAADSPALTQAHGLAADDSEHDHTADQPAVAQAHAVAAQDATHAAVADEPTVEHIHQLAAADASHGHTADAPALTQTHALTAADASHVQAADQPSVAQVHAVAADDAEHGHAADSPGLTQVHLVAADGSTHQHAADAPALTQLHELAAGDSAHGHTADPPTISGAGDILADDASHGQTADSPTLTQVHELSADGAAHSHVAEAPTLAQAHALAADDAAHAQSADQPTLSQVHAVAAADATHGQTADQPSLTGAGVIAPQDASHSHAADQPTLTGTHQLTTADATHGQTADATTVGDLVSLAPADSAHGHTAGAPTLSQQHAVVVDAATHAQLAEQAALTQLHLLAAADAVHAHTADVATVADVAAIVPAERLTPGSTRPSLTPGGTRPTFTAGLTRPVLTPGGSRDGD